MNNIKTALKYMYHQRWILPYSDFLLESLVSLFKRICPIMHEDASLAAGPCFRVIFPKRNSMISRPTDHRMGTASYHDSVSLMCKYEPSDDFHEENSSFMTF